MAVQARTPWREAFGARIRSARLARGLTQEGLAETCGLHPTYIGDAERGERNVSLDNILRLAYALKVRPGELLDGLERRIPKKVP